MHKSDSEHDGLHDAGVELLNPPLATPPLGSVGLASSSAGGNALAASFVPHLAESTVLDLAGSTAATTTTTSTTTAATNTATATASSTSTTHATSAPSWISTLTDTVLKADMTAMGGTVTESGLAKMVTDLGAELTGTKTLSASQMTDLKTIVADLNVGETASAYSVYTMNALVNGNAANAHWTGGASGSVALGNLAVGETAAHLSELEGKWLLGTDLASSSVSVDGQSFSISYATSTKPLFASTGPSAADINQGSLGDCYLLSSLAEVATKDPNVITNMITNNGNGTYGVCFHVGGQSEYVTVNSALQSGCNTGPDMWGTLVEKAYAELQSINLTTGNTAASYGNSFSSIGNGGQPESALESITGATQITDFYASGSAWGKQTYNASLSVTGNQGGQSTASVLATLKADLSAGDDVVLSSNSWSYDSSGKVELVASHAMSVYGIDAANGNLEIRNPWGTQAGQYWDTTFEVSLATLQSAGDVLTADNVGGTTPSPTPVAPVLVAATGNQTLAANHAFSIALGSAFTDPQGQALSYKVVLANGQALPSWMSFNAQTDTLSGTTPITSYSGQIQVTATDTSGLSTSESFVLSDTVSAPTLANATATQAVTPGHAFSFALPAGTFVDPQGETLSYKATLSNGQALPSWLAFNTQTQTFTGTAPTATSTLAVTVTASNQAGLSTSETFQVNDAYAAPTLTSQTATQTETANKAFSFALAANTFTDPQALAMTYKATLSNGQALPSWLTFNAKTETFSGTAPATAGTTGITVTATDSMGLSSSETFNISDVLPVVNPPQVNPLPLAVSMNTNGTLNIAVPQGTFVDPQGQALTYSASQSNGSALPSWLTFNAKTDTLTASFGAQTEQATITLKATDVSGLSATETFSIALGGVGSTVQAVASGTPDTMPLVGVNLSSADLAAMHHS